MELSLASKVFLASAVAWVTGRSTHLRIKGTPEEVEVIKLALNSTRDLLNSLQDETATIESVIIQLNIKNSHGREFERITGFPWPL